eukprot:TRINITY_DN22963_c0_g1_i1.p1 TRINITY_DN22963_c0_g1~~TRINITY_DN22963_c0_g1_i1.p1  ORF type:complete len:593 (-),score=170.81 TRINITY_DN22963_c0_g1_i1:3-1745(-)
MAVKWPDWGIYKTILDQNKIDASNSDFHEFKRQVVRASAEELDEQADIAAPLMLEFLLAFAAKKKMFRSLVIQIFNKLMEAPKWAKAWEENTQLHERVKELHEDVQAAIGAQLAGKIDAEALKASIAPSALKSIASLRQEEKPEEVRIAVEKERMVDAIQEEDESTPGGKAAAAHGFGPEKTEAEDVAPVEKSDLFYLQEGIDAVSAIDSASKMDDGGVNALNKLRIGCIRCAGNEELFQQELRHAPKVFNFLMSFAKQHPESINGVAEVMNQLMASASWSSLFESNEMVKDRLKELPSEMQAALALQSEKIMRIIDLEAKKKADGGLVPTAVKGVADRMQSIRSVRPSGGGYAGERAELPKIPEDSEPDKWEAAKTPEGHTYYFNVRTRETTWERPAALGGPLVYKVGDDVEVWSNSMRSWGKGKVTKVDGAKVLVEFRLPDGSMATKELPAQHKDLRPAEAKEVSGSAWSSEEKAAYQLWFDAVEGGSATSKPGLKIAEFLKRSKLPRQALRQVWMVVNPSNTENIDFEGFAGFCRLIAHCQALGVESSLVQTGDRPLRVKLRTDCLTSRPPALPRFS